MGKTQLKAELVGYRSSHNSAQDTIDQGNWLTLMGEIQRLLEDDRYKDLEIDFSFPHH